ncbi:MAG: hypothetical protein EHM42_01035 [Planctomycetaceae bacterium]|nr:MAG: hypothetical protein EHM42_01035 [Planctomycetaceae bacterium]
MVTCGTYLKEHHFRTRERLDHLTHELLTGAAEAGWNIEGWAVFSNHYHIIAHSQPGCGSLDGMLKKLHAQTAQWVNELDDDPGRQVWHNFWDTKLTFEKSYLARLNYVQQNAVKHRLVAVARDYPWCSAGWFERAATPAQVKTVASFRYDRIKVVDDFEPIVE